MSKERALTIGIPLFPISLLLLQFLMFKPSGCGVYRKTSDGCAIAGLDLGATIIMTCVMIIGWSFLIVGIVCRGKKHRGLVTDGSRSKLVVWPVVGASLAILGFVSFEMVFFKPWISCDYSYTSADCSGTDVEERFLLGSLDLFLAGLFILVCSFIYWLATQVKRML